MGTDCIFKQNLTAPANHLDGDNICHWVTSVEAIGRDEWNACFEPGDVVNCFDLAKALENSKLPDTEFHYLVGSQHGQVAFVIPCFLYATPLDVLAPPWVRRLCFGIRKYYSSFLIARALIVGSPLAICTDSLGLERLNETQRQGMLARLKEQLISKGKSLKAHLVVVKEIAESKLEMVQTALQPQFFIVPSMPEAYVTLSSNEYSSYKDRLRCRYRNVLRQRKRLFENSGACWEVIDHFVDYADDLWSLYQQVFSRSKSKFMFLTPELFKQVSSCLGKKSYILIANNDNRPMAFGLILVGKKTMYPLYLGLDYSCRDQFALFYNILYRSIEEAEKLGYEVVSLGQTAYESKALMGASFRKLFLGLCPLSVLLSVVLRAFHSFLFPSITLPHFRVFKDQVKGAENFVETRT